MNTRIFLGINWSKHNSGGLVTGLVIQFQTPGKIKTIKFNQLIMKCILTIILACFSYSVAGQTSAKDYRPYFQIASYATYKLKTGSPDDYIHIMKSLATEYKQFPLDYPKLGALLFEKDTSSALSYMGLAISKGYSLGSLQNHFEKEEDKEYIEEKLNDKYIQFLNQRNNDFVIFLESLIKTDQLYRAETFGLPDSIRYIKQDSIDLRNLMMLKSKIEQYGWPSYSMVGSDYAGVAFIVVLHGTRQFAPDSEVFQFFESLLLNELKSGNFSPISFSNWIDQYYSVYQKLEQPYGSMANAKGVLYPINDIEECNRNRFSIGLPPLSEHLLLTGYRLN